MKSLHKITGINLLVLTIYSVMFLATKEGDMYQFIIRAFALGLHLIVALLVSLIALITGRKLLAKNWLLASLVVLVIGFSFCLGTEMI